MRLLLQASLPVDETLEILVDHFPFVVGRRSESDCPLHYAFVSRQHCRFTLAGDEVFVQDLESHNGTFVNGRPASIPLPINHGDELCLGPLSFSVIMRATNQETMDSQIGPTREETSTLAGEGLPHHPSGSKG